MYWSFFFFLGFLSVSSVPGGLSLLFPPRQNLLVAPMVQSVPEYIRYLTLNTSLGTLLYFTLLYKAVIDFFRFVCYSALSRVYYFRYFYSRMKYYDIRYCHVRQIAHNF